MIKQIIEYPENLQTKDNCTDISDYAELSYHPKILSILDDLDLNDMTKMIRTIDSEYGITSIFYTMNVLISFKKLIF